MNDQNEQRTSVRHSSMTGKKQNLGSPLEKAIRTDSHTKHSDSLWRQFRSDKTAVLPFERIQLRVAKRLSVGESRT
jgi:hypothetical protein